MNGLTWSTNEELLVFPNRLHRIEDGVWREDGDDAGFKFKTHEKQVVENIVNLTKKVVEVLNEDDLLREGGWHNDNVGKSVERRG